MVASQFVDVIIPVPIPGAFTYRVPDAMLENVHIGSRVIVPFGKRKFYTGIITAWNMSPPTEYTVKEIASVLDETPIVRNPQIRFWEWMAEYYLCELGDVYKAAVPSGLKIESETKFEPNPDYDEPDVVLLNEREKIVYAMLRDKGKLTVKEIETQTGFKNITTIMQRLTDKGAAIVSESLVSRYRPKKEAYARLLIEPNNKEALRDAFDKVKGAPKQESLLLALIHMSDFSHRDSENAEVKVAELLEKGKATSTILKALVDKGIAQRYTKEVSRFKYTGAPVVDMPTLSEAQQAALQQVHKSFIDRGVTLLHGVTSSGKTEVYSHLAQYVLEQGKQVLYLVPEIALTTQLTSRLQKVFGDKLIVYHSKFTDNERVEIWHRLLKSSQPLVVVGARSSVFLPFAQLGLVIVDEEHDPSYKQYDPAPRYNARDAAIMLAHMHGAKTLLGSATPSVETNYKALSGKYGLVKLTERFLGARLPEIEIVDLGKEMKKKQMKGSFAIPTISAVRQAVADGGQAILFHNRRGFAPMAHCTQCQFIPKCRYCDVSLTYHKGANSLVCHYCGSHYPLPETCPVCKQPTIEVVGYGTERIAEEVEEIFSDKRTLRMDLDTTRNKNSYEKIITEFSEHKADILVGTQMVTKGLDFGDVTLVGVVNADALINFPDFRSAERAFNMLEQVSGRAGRRESGGKVLIQTRNPEHHVIKYVCEHDYDGFYNHEIAERQAFAYPPFTRLIYIYMKHRDERELDNLASIYGMRLRELFGTRVSGPTKPNISRVQNLYIRQLMLKVELNASMQKVKEVLRQLNITMHTTMPGMRQAILYYDVDPV